MSTPAPRGLGIAGRLAATFIDSKLTPLIVIAALLLGGFATWRLPREEEPQIKVPMIDVFVAMPGASAREVETRVTRPLERLAWEIPGVEYVYSTSSPDQSLIIVRFLVGTDPELASGRLRDKLDGAAGRLPPGASAPLVVPRSIDDVPVLALTLSGEGYDGFALRRIAAEVASELRAVPDVSEVTLIGGERRVLSVELDPLALAARGITPLQVSAALAAVNRRGPAGEVSRDDRRIRLDVGGWLRDAGEVARVVIATQGGHPGGPQGGGPVRLGDVATVADGGDEAATYVVHGLGAAASDKAATAAGPRPAVTIALAKRKGTNAIDVVQAALAKMDALRGDRLPREVDVAITRDYGATAAEKSNELLFHMALAVLSVAILMWLALGRREAVVVLLAIPATLALTLFVFYLYGYTLNRITLFALIFSIGILVDDAIVVVENIVRHLRLEANRERDAMAVAVEAVDEVGNPTILATLAVIAAILPMAFVGSLMGPYMRPIPVGASAAMVFSLLIAFIVTPWATVRLLRRAGVGHAEREGFTTRLYRSIMGPLLSNRGYRTAFLAGVVLLLVAVVALVPLRVVQVKMLPFDNKSEMQVVLDLPEGETLERTTAAATALASVLARDPAVHDYQIYAGTAGPYNFNGLVRHWFLRRGPNIADIQVNLVGKHEREEQSHDIAKRLRVALLPVAARFDARLRVAEVPPGPPVLQTLVAEVYGPEESGRRELALAVKERFEATSGVVDVDWYVEDPQPRLDFEVDGEKAALAGVDVKSVAATMALAVGGQDVGLLHAEREQEDVQIRLRVPRATRADPEALMALRVPTASGGAMALAELVTVRESVVEPSIYHKNLLPVVYVTADLADQIESPVYAILELFRPIAKIVPPDGYRLVQHTAALPTDTAHYALKWDGEWHITYEVFRDLGIAFAAVLVLIYVLVVAWFQSFLTPLVIMSAIPFSLVGILPAHAAMGAFFTATSMIGFIAGAGIVVRNSIILVDFIELRRAQGMALAEAVVDAGAVRFRPMVLTAAAVIAGAAVILFDPIFQGLAISLMAGEVASLLLSRMTVPVVYFLAGRRLERQAE